MARGLVSIKNSGLTEIANHFDKLADNYNEVLYKSVQSMQDVVVEAVKYNVVSIFSGETGAYIFDSVGKSTEYSREKEFSIVGTVGIYQLDAVDTAFDKTDKDMNAAQIAYWTEFGTSGLKSGLRRINGTEYSDDDIRQNSAPKPLVGNAVYTTIEEQNQAFKMTFNKLMDGVK